MATKAKVKVLVDGKETEIEGELVQSPDGYMSEEQHNVRMQSEIQRRVTAAKNNARTELLEDATFKTEASKHWNLVEKGSPSTTPSDDQIQALRESLEKEHVAPLRDQLKEKDGQISKFQLRMLKKEILVAAAAANVKKPFLTPPASGKDAPIVTFLLDMFGFDGKTESFALKSGDGFAFSAAAKPESPYKGVEEYLTSDFRKQPEFADWFDRATQDGPQVDAAVGEAPNKAPTQWSSDERRTYIDQHGAEAYGKLLDQHVRAQVTANEKGKTT